MVVHELEHDLDPLAVSKGTDSGLGLLYRAVLLQKQHQPGQSISDPELVSV